MSEVADGMMQIKLDMIKTALMIGDHDLSMDQLIKVQQCFTENQLESGFVVGTQESAIDTLYIIRTGTCVAQLDVTMVSPLIKKRSTPRASNGVPSVEPMTNVRKSLLVSTAGPGECMGLVDYYVGGGSWTVNVFSPVNLSCLITSLQTHLPTHLPTCLPTCLPGALSPFPIMSWNRTW